MPKLTEELEHVLQIASRPYPTIPSQGSSIQNSFTGLKWTICLDLLVFDWQWSLLLAGFSPLCTITK